MSRLSATFVLNYLTRVVPSLGHVGTKMKADRVVKGAAILVAIGGVFFESTAFAAPVRFSFSDLNADNTPRTGPVPNGAAQNYRTTSGVTVQMRTATSGTVGVIPPSQPGFLTNLGYGNSGGPGYTLTYTIDQLRTNAPFDSLALEARFLNAAGRTVPVEALRFRTIDIDKDDTATGLPVWQDEVTAFATFNNAPIATTFAIAAPTNDGTVAELTSILGAVRQGQIPSGLTYTGSVPSGLTFLGIDDRLLTSAVFAPTINDLFIAGPDVADNPGAPSPPGPPNPPTDISESYNRSQEGSVQFSTGTNPADGFVVIYSDGLDFTNPGNNGNPPNPVTPNPGQHGLGLLSDFLYTPGIIGVRKQVTNVVNNGSTVTVTYEVAVTNLGETDLFDVKLDDNLVATSTGAYAQSFGNLPAAGLTISRAPTPATGSTLSPNPGYDGNGNAQLLQLTGNSLTARQTKTLSYDVTFTQDPVPGNRPAQYNSQVVASGNTIGGGLTQDRSNDGAQVQDDETLNADGKRGDSDPTAAPTTPGVFGDDIVTTAASFNPGGILTAASSRVDVAGSPSRVDDTVTSFRVPPPTPKIGVTKQVLGVPVPVAGQPGAYDITYRQIVSNVSSALVAAPSLSTVTLTENFSNNNNPDPTNQNAFRIGQANGAASATVLAGSVTSPATAPAGYPAGYIASTVNPAFSGAAGNTNLNAPITLANRGSYSIVDYVVRVVPQAGIPLEGLPPFEGQVFASGNFPTGQEGVTGETRDLSDDVTGVAADAGQISPADGSADTPRNAANLPQSNPIPSLDGPNGANAATNENNRTPVTLSSDPAIGLLKRVVGTPTNNGDGTYNVTFRYTVTNTGPVGLTGVSISDNIQAQFADNGLKPVVSNPKRPIDEFLGIVSTDTTQPVGNAPAVAGLSANRALSDTPADALSTVATLAPGQSSVVDVVVKIRPGAANLSYSYDGAARAAGVGTNAARTPVADISDDGTIIGGIAQTPTPNTLRPAVGNPNDPNAQNPTPVVLDPIKVTLYKAIITVPGQNFTTPLSAEGLVLNAPDDVKGVSKLNRNLTNGDQVIYTLYAVNSSGAPIVDFEVCDALKAGQLLVIPNTLPLPAGVTSVGFGPLTPPTGGTTLLPLGRTCDPRTGGVGGTIVFTIPSLPTGTTALPFTIRVNR
jgi:hypothetical protein